MADKKAARTPEPARVYPGIETFLETRDRSDLAGRFAAIRDDLAGLPKAKAEQSKRALAALDRTQALLHQLFDVKEQMQGNQVKKTKR